jgi:hypothetical protein
MPIIAKAGAPSYPPAPEGPHAAVCVDVIDLGVLEQNWNGESKKQHKIKIVWQIDEDRDDGKPHQVQRRYTLSLHEKAGLRKDLESWRGRAFTQAELDGFDVETVLGVPCLLNIVHAKGKDGGLFANIMSVMKLPKSMNAPTQRDYVRVIDREPAQGQSGPNWGEITDDDVPF